MNLDLQFKDLEMFSWKFHSGEFYYDPNVSPKTIRPGICNLFQKYHTWACPQNHWSFCLTVSLCARGAHRGAPGARRTYSDGGPANIIWKQWQQHHLSLRMRPCLTSLGTCAVGWGHLNPEQPSRLLILNIGSVATMKILVSKLIHLLSFIRDTAQWRLVYLYLRA